MKDPKLKYIVAHLTEDKVVSYGLDTQPPRGWGIIIEGTISERTEKAANKARLWVYRFRFESLPETDFFKLIPLIDKGDTDAIYAKFDEFLEYYIEFGLNPDLLDLDYPPTISEEKAFLMAQAYLSRN